MSLTSPRESFEETVRPAVQDYLSDPHTNWKSKAAASELYNFAEWVFKYFRDECLEITEGDGTLGSFRKAIIAQCPDIQAAKDIADGARHRFLDEKREYRLGYTSTGLVAPGPDGLKFMPTNENLSAHIQGALTFWEKWLRRTGF